MGYYSGDPGFFSLLKKAGGFAASFIPGIGGTASKIISKIPVPVRAGAMRAGTMIAKHPVLSAAGAAGAHVGGAETSHLARGGAMYVGGGGHIKPENGRVGRHTCKRVTNTRAVRRPVRRAHRVCD